MSLTTPVGLSIHVEGDLDGGPSVGAAYSRRGQASSTPAWLRDSLAGSMRGQNRGVAPSQVLRAELSAIVPVILLGEGTVGGGVLSDDSDEAISEVLYGVEKGGVGCRAGVVRSCGDAWKELAEERKGS